METADNSSYVAPTVMFVLYNHKKKQTLSIPYVIDYYSDQEMESVLSQLILDYPPENFLLEMVIYTRLHKNHEEMPSHDIWFGARDSTGATIHTVYNFRLLNKKQAVITHKMIAKPMDTWVPRVSLDLPFIPVQDAFLQGITSLYATLLTARTHFNWGKKVRKRP